MKDNSKTPTEADFKESLPLVEMDANDMGALVGEFVGAVDCPMQMQQAWYEFFPFTKVDARLSQKLIVTWLQSY